MATAAGAFGGLLARGISEMDGVGGRGGWAWIFILEGIVTVGVACWAYWAFQDYPETAKFITDSERKEIQRRLEEDRGSLADEWDRKYITHALTDWKVYMHCFNFLGFVVSGSTQMLSTDEYRTFASVYSFSLFLPTIVRDLGYSNEHAQLMTVPPYVVACFFCLTSGWLCDRLQTRGIVLISFNIVGIVGLIMLISSTNNSVRYAATFFYATGVYPNTPQCMVSQEGSRFVVQTR